MGGFDLSGTGLALGVLLFPWWRRKVVKNPERYTDGHPPLPDENPTVVRGSGPLSNVRIEGGSDC